MRFHRPHRRLRALNPRPRTRQTALTPRNAVFGTGAAFNMMADSHLVFNVLTTGRGDVCFGPKADISQFTRYVKHADRDGGEMFQAVCKLGLKMTTGCGPTFTARQQP